MPSLPVSPPKAVWVLFDSPIEPRTCTGPRSMPTPDVQLDPPLDVDRLPGLLTAWRSTSGGWEGMVEYPYPHHGYGLTLRLLGWINAQRLVPAT